MWKRAIHLTVLFLFLFSGASGLIYQVLWTKKLTLIMGVTVFAVSTVLSAFMAGLALGSHLFGKWADRSRNPLLLYAVLEGLIGLYALLIPVLFSLVTQIYVELHASLDANHLMLLSLRFFLCFLVLLLPTTLMGGTLPVLTKFFVEREKSIGLGVALLYAINTTGAVGGCFSAGFFLIPFLGITKTTAVAVAINIGVALLALLISSLKSLQEIREPTGTPADGQPEGGERFSPRVTFVVFWAIGLSGFVALGYEVLWTRVLVYFLGPSTYAFTTMLTAFLMGIAMGSFLIARFTDRMGDPVTVLGLLETGLGVSALVAVLLINRMNELYLYLTEHLGSSSWWVLMSFRFSLAFAIMFLPTLFMGASFPVAARIYSRGLATIGKRVGNIYSINTLCAIFGSLVTGFLLIPWLGIQRSMIILIVINLLIGALLYLSAPRRGWAARATLASLAVLAIVGAATKFEDVPVILSFKPVSAAKDRAFEILYCKEGLDASVSVLEYEKSKARALDINGTAPAATVVTDLQVHRLLAHIPMAIHPEPEKALVVGFGFGSTAYGCLQYDVERVDCVELVDNERETAAYFEDQNHGVLNDERFRFIAEDGRNFILTTRERYDVISVNAIHPSIGPNLYTHDFYELCRDKMTAGGLACVWLPTTMLTTEEFRILVRTFQDVFPYTTFWYNNPAHTIALGSLDPYKINFERFCRRLARPGVQADLASVYLEDPYTFLSLLIMLPDQVEAYCRGAVLNTDDFPCIEFSRGTFSLFQVDMLERIFFSVKADIPSFLTSYGETPEERRRVEQRFAKYNRAWPLMVEAQVLSFGKAAVKETASAQKCIRRALQYAPKDRLLLYLARNFEAPEDIRAWRIRKLKEKLDRKEGNALDARIKLAGLFLDGGHFDEAVEVLEPAVTEAAADHLEFQKILASACAGADRIDEACCVLEKAQERFPDEPSLPAQLTRLLLLKQSSTSREAAVQYAEMAVQLEESAEHLDLLGVALYENGRHEEAEALFSRALKKGGIIRLKYKYHLAMARSAQGVE